MGTTFILVAIELLILIVGLFYVVQNIEQKNWKKAVMVVILLLVIMTIIYFGLIPFVTNLG